MKFLDFVSCCGTSRPVDISAATDETPEWKPFPANIRRRKQWRLRGAPSGQSAEWKPLLSSISEDNDVSEKIDRRENDDHRHHRLVDRTVRKERKKESASRSLASDFFSYNVDYRRNPFPPAVISAFSPTPYMF